MSSKSKCSEATDTKSNSSEFDQKASPLTKLRKERIESDGATNKKESWADMLQQLLDYKEEHGDCLVPSRYQNNRKLGFWVMTQRRQYILLRSGKPSTLTRARIQALNIIGFVWQVRGKRQNDVSDSKLTVLGQQGRIEAIQRNFLEQQEIRPTASANRFGGNIQIPTFNHGYRCSLLKSHQPLRTAQRSFEFLSPNRCQMIPRIHPETVHRPIAALEDQAFVDYTASLPNPRIHPRFSLIPCANLTSLVMPIASNREAMVRVEQSAGFQKMKFEENRKPVKVMDANQHGS